MGFTHPTYPVHYRHPGLDPGSITIEDIVLQELHYNGYRLGGRHDEGPGMTIVVGPGKKVMCFFILDR